MSGKLGFAAGVAVGYVVGTRVGRKGYDSLKKNMKTLWRADQVQGLVVAAEGEVKEAADGLVEKAKSMVGRPASTAEAGSSETIAQRKTGTSSPISLSPTRRAGTGPLRAVPPSAGPPLLPAEKASTFAITKLASRGGPAPSSLPGPVRLRRCNTLNPSPKSPTISRRTQ